MQQIPSSGNNPQRRIRGFSWKYDEDHHIGEYSVENTLLPIDENAYQSEYEYEHQSEYEFEYEHEHDDCETNQENGMEFCEPGVVTDEHQNADFGGELSSTLPSNNNNQRRQQQPPVDPDPQQYNYSGNAASRRRRRRPLRKALGKAWEIPSQAVMQRRNRFRQIVHDETRQHRRILPRGDNNDRAGVGGTNTNSTNAVAPITTEAKPKNVLELLRDREVFGGGSSSNGIQRTSSYRGGIIGSSKVVGGRPSGFRVGVSIATPAESEDDGAAEHRRRRRRKKRHRNAVSTKQPSPSTDATTAAAAATDSDTATTATRTTNRHWNSRSHRHTTDELRTFAEHACVTKFESSYLSHLQHDDVEEIQQQQAGANETTNGNGENNENANNGNNAPNANANANQHQQQQQQASSKAVSTISIAFSPDGKTMASTHGDHTVKITCCMTGKLLQTLVGHPRTPWTVKYHPHAGANHNQNSKTKRVIIANSTNSSTTNNNNNLSSSNTPGAALRPVSGLLAALREASSKQQQQQEEQQQQQQIVASGCLGHQVRIWDWISGTCLQMIRLEFPIISLSFHPSGSVLAIANGTRLHFWGLPTVTQAKDETNKSGGGTANATNGTTTEGGSTIGASENGNSSSRIVTNPSRGMHIEMRHMLRCVHFLPDGKNVIVGGVNPQTSAEIRRQRRLAAEGNNEKVPTMSFYLRLWDFDLDAAKGLHSAGGPSSESDRREQAAAQLRQGTGGALRDTVASEQSTSGIGSSNNNNSSSSNTTQQQSILESSRAAAAAAVVANNMAATTRRRRAISNPRCFVPRALLYNDGGFDVSPDGKTLCACAEYWLPEGVGNATDLLHPPEKDDDDDDFDYGSGDDSSSDGEGESHCSDNEENDVKTGDASDEEGDKNQSYPKQSPSKADKDAADTADSSGGVASADAKESNPSKEKSAEDSKRKARNPSTSASNISPTRPQPSSSSLPSATPPRISNRQQRQIASPPLAAVGATAGTMLNAATYGQPLPPIQAGLTPQTPPPNVNPLNFPLSPPSPPGRRFAGGLSRGTQQSSQQHEQLLQQYNRQQVMLHQQRHNQQQQVMPPPQQQRGGSTSTPPSRGTENGTTTIPAPPGINHRNQRQHRLHTQQSSASGFQKAGNPFATTSRNSRGTNAQRGRFVPHVVTISLDTEPYVDTTTEEVVVRSVDPVLVSSDASMMTLHQQSESSRIRTTTVAATSSVSANSTTTTFTTTTYNVPGRGAALGATFPHVLERRPRLGQLLSACPLDGAKASAVTCVKFSPCTDFCLIGYGVREPHVEEANDETNDPPMHPPYHPVTAMYKVNKGGTMRHVSTMLSGDDDVNIARFHPDSGYGFVYGTKQGRIRILGPRPWNYYNC